jgi:hypothetical protein
MKPTWLLSFVIVLSTFSLVADNNLSKQQPTTKSLLANKKRIVVVKKAAARQASKPVARRAVARPRPAAKPVPQKRPVSVRKPVAPRPAQKRVVPARKPQPAVKPVPKRVVVRKPAAPVKRVAPKPKPIAPVRKPAPAKVVRPAPKKIVYIRKPAAPAKKPAPQPRRIVPVRKRAQFNDQSYKYAITPLTFDMNATEGWNMSKLGSRIRGRLYSKHALERMAPPTKEVIAELEQRAIAQGFERRTREFDNYIKPRNISPDLVEETIATGRISRRSKPGTVKYLGPKNLIVITGDQGAVITTYFNV